ncbi:MAG TPA: hypothetical protein VGA70_02510 [Longimicrobiales bacterium]
MRSATTRHCATALVLALALAQPATAQISRHPTGVNVSAQGATTVFLTFGNLDGYVADEALWCGELIPANPDIGSMCDPATIFGSLPLRVDLSRTSGEDGFTDIMSIPPSVARRAYQAAADGATSSFFYVRRFIDPSGVGPDQYVTVTCRLSGGGARVPFSLLDVQVAFAGDEELLTMGTGDEMPPIQAHILYNGTGRLVGRWEVVLPGEEPPSAEDLLTEGTLPVEVRGTQRTYTELSRFNVFLPPDGEFVLEGPPVDALPSDLQGLYQVLLRIEASDDKEGDSSLAAAGAGEGTVHSGAVAGFPMPILRYFVGNADAAPTDRETGFQLLTPLPGVALPTDLPVDFTWSDMPGALVYRLEVRLVTGAPLTSAFLEAGTTSYRAPDWLAQRADGNGIRWRVVALAAGGIEAGSTRWRSHRWSLR